VVRRSASLYVEEPLLDRLRLYALALRTAGVRTTVGELLECAVWEYLQTRADALGQPVANSSPAVVRRYPGRGRPSRASAATYTPRLGARRVVDRRGLRVVDAV
jgi:hypothetical protein